MVIIMSIQVCLLSWMKFDYAKNGGKKALLQIQSINIVHPIMENMIAMPIAKIMEIVMGIQLCLISWMNFDFRENGGEEAVPANSKHQYRVSHFEEHDCFANNKKNGDCY